MIFSLGGQRGGKVDLRHSIVTTGDAVSPTAMLQLAPSLMLAADQVLHPYALRLYTVLILYSSNHYI